jgi:hypothetical protein
VVIPQVTRAFKVFGSIGLAFLVVAAVMWLVAFREIHKYRQDVLEAPTRFEKGASIDRSFTVDLPSTYWILISPIKYPTGYKFSLLEPTPTDPFVVQYQISSDDKIVANGDNRSDARRPAALRRNDYSRYIVQFSAEPRHRYKLSLHFEDVASEIASQPTTALVLLDPHVREGTNYLAALLRTGAIPVVFIGLVVASPLWYSLARRAFQKPPTT